jgi:hypothetical protein
MALSANTDLSRRNEAGMLVRKAVVATSVTIYKHAIVVMKNAGTSCKAAANETTTNFLGIAAAQYSAAATAKCLTHLEMSFPLKTGVTAGNWGALAYAYDDEKVTTANTLGPPIGIFLEIDEDNSANVWVHVGQMTALGNAS